MNTKKTMKGSSCNKSKLFDGLIGKHVSEIDPCYKLFLDHLSKDGNTCVLDVPNGDHGMPVSVRYEEENKSYGNAKDKNGPSFLNGSLRRSLGVPNGKRPDVKAVKAASGNVGHSSPRRSNVKKKKKTSSVDESYELFLSLVKFKDGFMVIEPEPGVTIVYEQEDMPARCDKLRTNSSTNEPEPLMSPLENMEEDYAMHRYDYGFAQANEIACVHQKGGPSSKKIDGQDVICTDELGLVLYAEPPDLNACEDEQAAPLAISCNGSSTFDEKLNAILNEPYDQNEYEELWRKATDRKPVSRQRHLRSASKRYVTEAIGLSYLDHYPDLAVQINSADCDGRLSLLRKLFFWLENLCHEGAYMPWISKPLACNPISPDEYEPTPALETCEDEPSGGAVS